MAVLDILRYSFYALDFIFGVLSWGITTDKLDIDGFCLLSDSRERAESTSVCSVVIAFGVIAMIFLVAIVVLRTLDYIGIMKFPELIEFFTFCALTLLWFILAIVVVAVTNTEVRKLGRVRGAIAGAWIAFFTHIGSTVISFLSREKQDEAATPEAKE